jgi:hypothetical protein
MACPSPVLRVTQNMLRVKIEAIDVAKLPALVSALASCDDRDLPTLEHIARVIREAGLLPTTKRGSGAADMGPKEAALLLIGANSAASPRGAAEAVRLYRDLTFEPGKNFQDDSMQDTGSWGADFVNQTGTFETALTGLIEHLPKLLSWLNEQLPRRLRAPSSGNLLEVVLKLARVQVEIFRPIPNAEIRLSVVDPDPRYTSETLSYFDRLYMRTFELPRNSVLRLKDTLDRRSSVTFGLKTLAAMNAAVSEDSSAEQLFEERSSNGCRGSE